LAQSIKQCGKQKDKRMFYIYLFHLNHGSKVEVLQEIHGKLSDFLMNFISQGMNLSFPKKVDHFFF
jgi:hypothetical protein